MKSVKEQQFNKDVSIRVKELLKGHNDKVIPKSAFSRGLTLYELVKVSLILGMSIQEILDPVLPLY